PSGPRRSPSCWPRCSAPTHRSPGLSSACASAPEETPSSSRRSCSRWWRREPSGELRARTAWRGRWQRSPSRRRCRRCSPRAAVARAIAEQYPERLDERAALLAQHWEAAGETLEAARWHARAAAWSGTGDPAQALRHWRKVRELADALPESEENVALRLEARI